jgi:hypothetical protein
MTKGMPINSKFEKQRDVDIIYLRNTNLSIKDKIRWIPL